MTKLRTKLTDRGYPDSDPICEVLKAANTELFRSCDTIIRVLRPRDTRAPWPGSEFLNKRPVRIIGDPES